MRLFNFFVKGIIKVSRSNRFHPKDWGYRGVHNWSKTKPDQNEDQTWAKSRPIIGLEKVQSGSNQTGYFFLPFLSTLFNIRMCFGPRMDRTGPNPYEPKNKLRKNTRSRTTPKKVQFRPKVTHPIYEALDPTWWILMVS